MTSKYEIREYLSADKEEVFTLIEEVWNKRIKENLQIQWDWKFFKQAHLQKCCATLHVILFKEKIIGIVGLMPSKMQYENTIFYPVFGTDLGVHPKYRGAGVQLIRYLFKLPDIHLIGTPNERAYRLEKKMGFIDVAQYDDYVVVINLKDILLSRSKSKLISAIAGLFYKVGYLVLSLRFDRTKNPELTWNKIECFDHRFDQFWQDISPTYNDFINVRDREFLAWRFEQVPNRDYLIFTAESKSQIKGYIVISIRNKKDLLRGRIVDFLMPKGDKKTLGFLIQNAMQELIKREAVIIETSITSDQDWCEKVLKKNGFLIKNKGSHVDIFIDDESRAEKFASKQWYMTFADSDLDFTE